MDGAKVSDTKLAYTVPAFCDAAGIGKSKLYEMLAAGEIKAKKVGKRTLIPGEEGRRWLASLPAFVSRAAA